jgi:hypothetical protein
MKVVENLIFTLFLLSSLLLLIGLISPKIAILWGEKGGRNRKKVLSYYGVLMLASFILLVVLVPTENTNHNAESRQNSDVNKESNVEVEKEKHPNEKEEIADQQGNSKAQSSDEKQESSKVDIESESDKEVMDDNNQQLSREEAKIIVQEHFLDATISSIEEKDKEFDNELYYFMNGITGTSPAFEVYVNEDDGKLYTYNGEEMLLMSFEDPIQKNDKDSEQAKNENTELYVSVTDIFYDSNADGIYIKGKTNLIDGIDIKVNAINKSIDSKYDISPYKATVNNGSFTAELGIDTYVMNGIYNISIRIFSEENPQLIEQYGEYEEFHEKYEFREATVEKAGWISSQYTIENPLIYQINIDNAWTPELITQHENQLKMENAWAIDYDQLAKSPDRYKGEYVTFTGEISNIYEGENESYMIIAVTKNEWGYNYQNSIVADYKGYTNYSEGDIVTVFGEVIGAEELENSFGGRSLHPSIELDIIQ